MNEKNEEKITCETCMHFIQHYRFEADRNTYVWVNCGHCICCMRSKQCQPLSTACKRYQPQSVPVFSEEASPALETLSV